MTEGNRLLVFGSYDADLHPRVAVLRDGLAGRGWQVEQCNAPLGASTSDKVAAASSPAAAIGLALRQLRAWGRLVSQSRHVAHPDVVLVGYMGHADVHLARILFRRSVVALDHLVSLADTVGDRRLGGGVKVAVLELADRAALGAADVVVVDTTLQAVALPERVRHRAVVVPVGAGREWAEAARRATAAGPGAAAGAGPGDRPLRVVFFGLYTPLQGAPTIGAAIALLRDDPIEFTMIGHGQDLAETRALAGSNPHVRWRDWVDGEQLPDVVAGHDVCLGVFGIGPKTQRVVPTKVYQGMAAGCAVVTGDTPACENLGNAVVLVPPGDPRALAAQLRRLAVERETLTMARRRAREAAHRFSPESSTAELDARLAERSATAGRHGSAPLPPLTMNAWLRWDVIARELDRTGAQDVLEIGPGEGAAACRLAEGRAYTGVEISPRTRGITERRLAQRGTPGRLVGSLDDLAPEETFDLVCAFEVIEHIEDDRAALAAWCDRVRPGGALILSTPYGPDRMGAADVVAGHFRRYTAVELEEMARAVGFAEARVVHVGYPLGYALEAVRNRVASRRLAQRDTAALSQSDVADFTEGSSSFLQPPAWSGTVMRIASAPGRRLQRLAPDRGPGLVMIARVAG